MHNQIVVYAVDAVTLVHYCYVLDLRLLIITNSFISSGVYNHQLAGRFLINSYVP